MAHRLPPADIQFIAEFAAFCRTKGDEAYCFTKPTRCAVAQFGYPSILSDGCNENGEQIIPQVVMDAACRSDDFAGLADRLESLISDAPVVERSL